MDTGKQINAMVVVLLLTVIAVGFYALFDPFRADTAEDDQLEMTAERGAHTFALNCRLCHGDAGEGGQMGGRLPAAPPLDAPGLQGFDMGAFSVAAFDEDWRHIFSTISCGRAGTAMPTWGRENGGTLSDEQIRQLAVLITGGDVGADPLHQGGFWEMAQHEADEIDAETTGHATLQMPDGSLDASGTDLVVSNAALLSPEQVIRIDGERMLILPKMLEVQRGVDGTEAAAHTSGTAVLRDGVDTEKTLIDDLDAESTQIIIDDTTAFSAGETLQLDDELVEVTEVITGVPTTNQLIIRDIGREPEEFFVSGADGIAVGDVIRGGAELMEVTGIREDGSLDILLDTDLDASDEVISVDDPAFFSPGYTFHVDDEIIEVIEAVETEQLLATAVGRAETTIELTGSEGVEAGDVIRLDSELLEIVEIQPATITVQRGVEDAEGNPTTPAAHGAGDTILNLVEEPEEGEEPDDPETGQTLLGDIDAETVTFAVSGTIGITLQSVIDVNGELMLVQNAAPAVVRVQRGVGDTNAGEHARRVSVFEGNQLAVERGALGTSPAAHDAGTELLFDVLEVDRAVGDTEEEDQAKNTELFIDNQIVVERAYLGTEAAEHMNGAVVRDFPQAPDAPATTGQTCGQNPIESGDGGGLPADEDREDVDNIGVILTEYSITLDAESAPAGEIDWDVSNQGTTVHNFRVIATELAADALPVVDGEVNEEELDVVGGFSTALPAGESVLQQNDLDDAGPYVLICNIPTHYELGMYTAFEVTAP